MTGRATHRLFGGGVRTALDPVLPRYPRPLARLGDQRLLFPAELSHVVVRQTETLLAVLAFGLVQTGEAGKLVPEALDDDRVRLTVVERPAVPAQQAAWHVFGDRVQTERGAAIQRRAQRRHGAREWCDQVLLVVMILHRQIVPEFHLPDAVCVRDVDDARDG